MIPDPWKMYIGSSSAGTAGDMVFDIVAPPRTDPSRVWRIRAYQWHLSGNIAKAAAGETTLAIRDKQGAQGVLISGRGLWVPAAALGTVLGGYSSPWIDLQDGVASSTPGSDLFFYCQHAYTTGTAYVTILARQENPNPF